MLFNSGIFLFAFLPVALIGFAILSTLGRRAVLAWLAFASVVFYSWWNWHFAFVLVGSGVVNFAISKCIAASVSAGRRKFWLTAGICIDLGALFYYKYLFHVFQFFDGVFHVHHQWESIALPLGISFFTFTQIAYLIDLAQGEAEPQSVVEYALFVTFFPHLIAGPILHHREMMPQFLDKNYGRLRSDDMLVGLSWFVLGMAKKCVLADRLANFANPAFVARTHLGVVDAWLGLFSYSLQLYFDFSGYSDMAIGLARMFSIRFPMNFNSPYKARNIIDFWQRWHMTLTRYLTLYLYNPISMSVNRARLQKGKKVSAKAARTVEGFTSMLIWPTMATMFLVGIWHGVGTQFMIFGLVHGLFLSVNHGWRIFRGAPAKDAKPSVIAVAASVLLTWFCVLIGQVFFRADSTGDAIRYFANMANPHTLSLHHLSFYRGEVLLILAGLFIVWTMPNTQQILGQIENPQEKYGLFCISWKPTLRWSLAIAMLLFIALLNARNQTAFLYFQF
ncbi:MBOAT family O-acyltransferase [Silvibacterium sp.]|uniref:MBOAT family O-acyltransferase n=1 Tax=Silvibacterium sp. TaxID=1964179 RepID=UPI0039E3770D